MRTLTPPILAIGLLASSPVWACGNDMAGGSSGLTDLVLISVLVVAGGALTVLGLAGLVGLPAVLLLRKRRADPVVEGAAGISPDVDGPPDVWVPGS